MQHLTFITWKNLYAVTSLTARMLEELSLKLINHREMNGVKVLVLGFLAYYSLSNLLNQSVSLPKSLSIAIGVLWACISLGLAIAIYVKYQRTAKVSARLWFAIIPIAIGLRILTNLITNIDTPELTPEGIVTTVLDWLEFIYAVLGAIAIAPFIEETIFRLYLLPEKATNLDIVKNALLFAVIHPWVYDFKTTIRVLFAIFIIGLVLAYTMRKTNNFYLVMVLHGLINLFSFFTLD